MIQWKNRPIADLTREELQLALTDAVRHGLAKDAAPEKTLLDSFLVGTFAGAAITLVGFMISTLLV